MATEISNAAIQQINISYNPVEDRLLLKIGFSDDAELAVWMTRRLVKIMWQLLQTDEIVSSQGTLSAGPLALDPARPAGLKKLDFTSEYKQRDTINQHAILLAKDCLLLKSADRQAMLELACSNGQAVKLALTPELAVALVNMLQLVSKETAWGLSMGLHAPVLDSIQTSTSLH